MKKFSFLFISLFLAMGAFAQCVVDSNLAVLDTTIGGFYPDANHIPHIIRDSAYNQTIQGKIMGTQSQSFNVPGLGPVTATLTVDTVRLDSLVGLPTGITWTKSSDILLGGGIGCVQFSGTTTDTPGVYHISAIGLIKVFISAAGGLFTQHDSSYGSLQRLPMYNNFFLVVDSAQTVLSSTVTSKIDCSPNNPGTATVFPAGGSPVNPYSYLWNNGVTSYTLNNLTPGTYYVTVTSAADTITDSVTIIGDPTPLAVSLTGIIPDSSTQQTVGTATLNVTGGTPPYTYRWSNGDSTAVVADLTPGTYRVTVTDTLGCRYRDSVVIANTAAGIANVKLDAKIGLYPNPANSVLNVLIESPVALNGKLQVVDITGKEVYSAPANVSTGHYNQTIDVKSFSPGIYILQLTSNNQSTHQRFVITR